MTHSSALQLKIHPAYFLTSYFMYAVLAARPCRPGTGIEATTKAARACSKGALSAKNPTLRRREDVHYGKSYAKVSM